MTLTLNTPAATFKQLAFLRTLIKERSTDAINVGFVHETIMNALTPDMFVSKAEASEAITALLAAPKIAAATATVSSSSTKAGLPLSNYALMTDGVIKFYRVAEYKGTRYLRQLIGHPGDWQKIKLSYPVQSVIMARLAADPLAAAQAFAQHYTVCAVCSSPLSDELSISRGIGPVCWARFA